MTVPPALSAARLFALFALLGGLVLVALIPPLGGGNETFNVRRAAAIASGHPSIEPAGVPGGIARFLQAGADNFPEGAQPPFSYSGRQRAALAAIPLDAATPATLPPDPIAVLHPFSYLPQLPVLWLGERLGLSPLILFYLGRLAGLLVGIALTTAAIRIMPVHKEALAAIALLPTILFSRSTFDADQLNNGLAFLLLATILREAVGMGLIRRWPLAMIVASAFVLAQCKSAYLLLPFFALAIPRARFATTGNWLAAMALIILPGLIGSLAWMITLKHGYFAGIRYTTWSGAVFPDGQMAHILADPLHYAGVLARTLFTTTLLPDMLVDFIGLFGPPVRIPALPLVLLLAAIAAVLAASRPIAAAALKTAWVRLLALAIVLASVLIVLTLLYLQWTRLDGPVIEGFQGRYLYPVIPLVLMLVPGGDRRPLGLDARGWIAVVGTVSVATTWWVTWATYLA